MILILMLYPVIQKMETDIDKNSILNQNLKISVCRGFHVVCMSYTDVV